MDIKESAKDFARDLERLEDKFKDLQREIENLQRENENLKSSK